MSFDRLIQATLLTDVAIKVSHYKWPIIQVTNMLEIVTSHLKVYQSMCFKTFDLCFADQTLFEKSDHSRKDHIASFTQWFNENGGKAEHVLIDDFGKQGLGLRAASDIKVMSSYCYMHVFNLSFLANRE